MVKKNLSMFRAYDVRGVYPQDVNERIAGLIGKAFGTYIGQKKRIVVSMDTRISGPALKKGLITGLISVGCDVVDIGVASTPMMYFSVRKYKFDGGISVTASHNPMEWNGFKMTKEGGVLCSAGMGMEEIRDLFTSEKFAKSDYIGTVSKQDVTEDYINFVLSHMGDVKKMKVVLDPGHGAGCVIAEKLFKRAGHDVSVINGTPDGTFPARSPEPKADNLGRLMSEVVSKGADIGLAFDGDADRVAIVDDKGRFVPSGNVSIPIFSGYYLEKNKGGKIVFDVGCSSFVEEFVKSKGGVPVVSRVGHSFIMNKMIEVGAVFGGEYSNHLYFSEVFGFDDAVFAGLKITDVISTSGKKISEIIDEIPRYPSSPEMEVHCSDKSKFQVVARVAERFKSSGYKVVDIDGAKAFDKDEGWVLVRASNTAPMIRLNSEGKTEEKMKEMIDLGLKITKEEVARSE